MIEGGITATFILGVSTLIPVMNPLSGGMFFAALTKNVTDKDRAFMSIRIAMYSLIVLVLCLSVGQLVLSFFGVSIGALRLAGGAIVILTGWHTLNDKVEESGQDTEPPSRVKLTSMAFYPLTLPLTTGPGAISVSVALGSTVSRTWENVIGLGLAILVSICAVWSCYRYSDKLNQAVGPAGADALTRLLGFILICMGTSIAWQGFSELWLNLNIQLHDMIQAGAHKVVTTP